VNVIVYNNKCVLNLRVKVQLVFIWICKIYRIESSLIICCSIYGTENHFQWNLIIVWMTQSIPLCNFSFSASLLITKFSLHQLRIQAGVSRVFMASPKWKADYFLPYKSPTWLKLAPQRKTGGQVWHGNLEVRSGNKKIKVVRFFRYLPTVFWPKQKRSHNFLGCPPPTANRFRKQFVAGSSLVDIWFNFCRRFVISAAVCGWDFFRTL